MEDVETRNAEAVRAQSLDQEQFTTPEDATKACEISEACVNQDIPKLLIAAASHDGLLSDDLRRIAWPILLGCDATTTTADGNWKDLPPHTDEEQVALDVNRSFVYYPDDPNAQIHILKGQLSELIVSVLRTHPSLSYFQGYHDIAQVLLLVLGPEIARPALARLSLLRIRDFMLPTLAGAIAQLHILPALLRVADPPLAKYLPHNPFWALAATLTLYAHDVQSYANIARLFDFLLAEPAVATLYLYAAVVKSRRDELLEIDPADEDILLVTLTRLPSNRMNVDELVSEALILLKTHPPESLGRAWRNISSCSVLRTASDAEAVREQSLIEGDRWLGYQSREAARQARMQAIYQSTRLTLRRYQTPAMVVLPMAVAIFAVWYGRSSGVTSRFLSLDASYNFLWKLRRSKGG